MKAFWAWVKKAAAALGDFFLDKQGGSDEKRLIGIGLFAAAVVYVFTRAAGPDVWTIAGGMAGFGAILLGVAGAQDGIQPPKQP